MKARVLAAGAWSPVRAGGAHLCLRGLARWLRLGSVGRRIDGGVALVRSVSLGPDAEVPQDSLRFFEFDAPVGFASDVELPHKVHNALERFARDLCDEADRDCRWELNSSGDRGNCGAGGCLVPSRRLIASPICPCILRGESSHACGSRRQKVVLFPIQPCRVEYSRFCEVRVGGPPPRKNRQMVCRLSLPLLGAQLAKAH